MLNMDFGQRVVVETAQAPWVASPASGVWRTVILVKTGHLPLSV